MTAVSKGIEPSSVWDKNLDEVDALLRQGEWKKGQQKLQKALRRMVHSMGVFEASPRPLARAVALQAIAATHFDQTEDAHWHWWIALNLDRQIQHMHLEPYGEAAVALGTIRLRPRGKIPTAVAPQQADGSPSTRPKRPAEQKVFYGDMTSSRDVIPPPLHIEVVVDHEGLIQAPLLLQPTKYPAFAFAAFQSMRRWRYEPATKNGEPVAALDQLRINFHQSW